MAESQREKATLMNASDLFVKALENEGVEVIYGVPGEENLGFLEALRKSSIQLILTRHEQGAAFMAATYGRLTGRPGVCLATLGPGATNLVTGAAYAQLGAFPMLMITGQKPIKTSKQGQFQIVDIVGMMRPLTKSTRQIVNVNMIPSLVREAFRKAAEERPGAVHLELPEDVAEEEVGDDTAPIFEVSKRRRGDADKAVVRDAIEMIRRAKHPLLLVGAGANRTSIWEALTVLLDQTGIPFFTTQMGKGVVAETHPLFLGTAALSDGDYLHCAIDRADLILNIGHDVVEKPPFFMEHDGAKVIHINFKSAEVDNVYFPQLEVVGDIATSLLSIAEQCGCSESHDFSYFMRVRENIQEHVNLGRDSDHFPMKPQRIVWDVREVMPDDGVIALDNGIYKIWFARNYPALQPNTVLLDNALASMGAGLPSAMEVARLYPKRRVMAICGDGGFMMNSQEMETAVRLKLNLTVLILRDDSYGMIRWKQHSMGLTDFGLQFGNPDFVKYAEAYGAHGHRVESADAFVPLMERCFVEGGLHLIDLPVDYADNQTVLGSELRERVCLL
ncbi:MAG: acetolactate synthase-1/2/3 large subunit [Myxococcota bacterium]|jgi:acetolactate synthase-1/2/3 large subunit